MEYIFVGGHVFFEQAGKLLMWDTSSYRALMLWTGGEFLLALLLTRASLRLPRSFIPYIMGALLLISPISFLLIFEKEIVALNFVSLFLNFVT